MKRRWGQNFLVDHNIAGKIVREAGIGPDDTVVEIGPGRGILTGRISDKAGRVIAVEIDRVLTEGLTERFKSLDNLEVINKDFLKTDLAGLLKHVSGKSSGLKFISNLPYNITTPVIMKVISVPAGFRPVECVFMVQKEVADRMRANPGGKEYGMLSVSVQYRCDVKYLFKVSRKVFRPRPTVDSAVIRLSVRKEPVVKPVNEELFFKVARAAFTQRRKKFYNSISNVLEIEKDVILRAMGRAGVDPDCRPETLSISQFAGISDLLYEGIK